MRTLLIAILITLGVSTIAIAEHEHERKKYDFYWSNMPTVCALKSVVDEWIKDKEFDPVSVGFGRENGQEDGDVVYAVTIYINPSYQMAAVVETPGGEEACIAFRTFDLKLNPNLRPGSNT